MNFIEKILKRYSIKKILFESFILVLGYPLYFVSFAVPRNRKKWVFGNKGAFSDNGKYLYLYLLQHTEETVYWVTSNRILIREMQAKGLPVLYKYSLKGLYHLLTAYYYVCTVSTNYINFWTSGGAYKVNLWHGVGLKSLDGSAAWLRDKSFVSKLLMPYGYEKYNLFLSTSPLMTGHFSNSFSIPLENVVEDIYPRCCFIRQKKDTVLQEIRKYEGNQVLELIESFSRFNRIYVYMPTWRLEYGACLLDYAIKDMQQLNESLKKSNSLLLLKLHPSMYYDSFRYKDLYNVVYVNPSMDVYPLLPFTDVLITDYSSIYYDYLLMDGKGCILYDFDYDSYIKSEFKFIRDYKEFTPGIHIGNFEDLIGLIASNTLCNVVNRDWVLKEFWGDYKEHNIESLYRKINCQAKRH